MIDIGADVTFEVDEFNRPKLLNSSETIKNVIMFLLYSKPGQIPSLPSIGMNIEKYLYEDFNSLDTTEIERNLSDQCSILGNYFNSEATIEKTYDNNIPVLKLSLKYSTNEITEKPYKDYQLGITYDELLKMIPET